MLFSVERAKLLEAVSKLQSVVGSKTSMPILECILISAELGKITLVSYNLEMGMKKELYAKCEQEGDIVINARLLADILRRMNGLQVELSADEKLNINIKSGEALFSAYYVFALCTDEKHRKKGYMERLLNRVIRESDRPLILRPSNEKLIGYYEKFGFKSFMAQDRKDRGLSVEPVGSFIPLTESEGKTNEGEFTAMVLNSPTHLDRIYFPYSIP